MAYFPNDSMDNNTPKKASRSDEEKRVGVPRGGMRPVPKPDPRGPYTPGKAPEKSRLEQESALADSYLKVFKKDPNFKNVEAGRKMAAKAKALGTMRKLLKGKKK